MHVYHAFLYISSPSMHEYDGKMPIISRFMEDVNKLWLNLLSLSELEYIWFLGIRLKNSSLAFDKVYELE